MVEMVETATILNHATQKSLVILDEIGRGTSTYDGLSIAWAALEYLHDVNGCRSIFATHYHELNELEDRLPRVKNFHITHKEIGNKIIFLRKMASGGSTHSFGIQVAKMAGMPNSLIDRANSILKQLEKQHVKEEGKDSITDVVKQSNTPQVQLSIFDAHSATFNDIRTMLTSIDINQLTPVEALMKLNEVKSLLK
jgi:DNA mismatch repair protein MutS